MKKVSVIVLAILVMASVAIAQNLGADRKTGSGSHVAGGCLVCHAPHTTGSNAAPTTTYSASAAIFDATFTGPTSTKISLSVAGGNTNNAKYYLWATALTPQVYQTWDGSGNKTFSAAGDVTSKSSAALHSILCLSCHDNSTGSHEMGSFNNTWSNNTGFVNDVEAGNGEAIGVSSYGSNGWNPTSSLMGSHPVHAQYTSGGYNWKIDANGNFTDLVATSGFTYGHPAKLWMDGGKAYVECTTCHDPHREFYTASWNTTTQKYDVSATPNTSMYVRGAYNDPTSTSTTGGDVNANFCRSCHFSKSQAYISLNGVAD